MIASVVGEVMMVSKKNFHSTKYTSEKKDFSEKGLEFYPDLHTAIQDFIKKFLACKIQNEKESIGNKNFKEKFRGGFFSPPSLYPNIMLVNNLLEGLENLSLHGAEDIAIELSKLLLHARADNKDTASQAKLGEVIEESIFFMRIKYSKSFEQAHRIFSVEKGGPNATPNSSKV